jgi:hypothetical protein
LKLSAGTIVRRSVGFKSARSRTLVVVMDEPGATKAVGRSDPPLAKYKFEFAFSRVRSMLTVRRCGPTG